MHSKIIGCGGSIISLEWPYVDWPDNPLSKAALIVHQPVTVRAICECTTDDNVCPCSTLGRY